MEHKTDFFFMVYVWNVIVEHRAADVYTQLCGAGDRILQLVILSHLE